MRRSRSNRAADRPAIAAAASDRPVPIPGFALSRRDCEYDRRPGRAAVRQARMTPPRLSLFSSSEFQLRCEVQFSFEAEPARRLNSDEQQTRPRWRAAMRPACRSLKQLEVDRFAHRFITGIIGMQVIAAVISRV